MAESLEHCSAIVSLDEMDGQIMTIGKQSGRPPSTSSISSINSGPEGFKNRKVELMDGYLIVSESSSPCTSIMGNTMDGWENVYIKHRDDIVDKNGFISTPLHVIKTLAKAKGERVDIEHFILKNPKKTSQIIYRVDIYMGSIKGVGQCTRKQLARQLAAIDVYEKILLQQCEPGYRPTPIPRCGLLPGWRVDKLVYPELFNNVCKSQGLETPRYKMVLPPDDKLGKFTAICRVGDVKTKGENDHPWLAKKLAAKEMYDTITGSEFPLKDTIMGADVINFPAMELLGFQPKITNLKRKWMMEHRIEDSQVVFHSDEPDDGDMDDVEEEAQRQRSKKLKLPTNLKETLKITLNKSDSFNLLSPRVVSSTSTSKPKKGNTTAPQALPMIKYEQQMDVEGDGDALVLQEDYDDEIFG